MSEVAGPVLFGVPRWPRHCLSRPRLWSAVDNDGEPSVLAAPHGAGKTTLLIDWARNATHADGSCLWWLDLADAGAGRPHIWAVISDLVLDFAATPGRGYTSPRAIELLTTASAATTDSLTASSLVARALVQISRPITLVLDHADRLAAETLAELLAWAARAPQLHLVMAIGEGRAVRTGRPGRLIRRHLCAVTGHTLAFRQPELRELLAARRVIGAEAIATPIQLLTLGDPRSSAALVDRFVDADVPPDPAHLRIALPESAEPGSVSAGFLTERLADLAIAIDPAIDLARQITGDPQVAELLDAAERRGWGMWTVGDELPRFAFVPYVQEMLRRFAHDRSEKRVREVAAIAADWAATRRQVVEELCALLEAGAYPRASELLGRQFGQLMLASDDVMAPVFTRMSTDQVVAAPGLALLPILGYTVDQQRDRALACLRAVTAAASGPEGELVAAHAAAIVARAAGDGDLPDAARRLEATLATTVRAAGDDVSALRAEAWLEVGLDTVAAQPANAIDSFERAAEAAPAGHPQQHRAGALVAALRAADGDLRQAQDALAAWDPTALPRGWYDRAPGIGVRVLEAWVALEAGDPVTALRHLRAAAATADPTEYWSLVAEPLAMAGYVSRGTHARRRRAARPAEPWPGPPPNPVDRDPGWAAVVARTRALADLAQNQPGRALHQLDRVPDADTSTLLLRARVHLFAHEPVAVRSRLDEARARGLTTHRARVDHAAIATALSLRNTRPDAHDRDQLDRLAELLRICPLDLPISLLPDLDRQTARLALRSIARAAQRSGGAEESAPGLGLSERELDILRQLAGGRKLSQIAANNVVSINTVKTQARSLYRKLAVASRNEAVVVGRELGLIDDGEA